MDKNSILKQYFGHDSFRDGQGELIDSILSGQDVMGIMPTGGGKSFCYQIPALLLPGITLVISPLISLMKDQVMALKEAGINAAFLNSSLNEQQLHMVVQRLRAGAYKIIYVAPERLEGGGFISLAQKLNVSLVAVDEAHCISQWGQDFRPSYLKITEFILALPKRPVVAAFTATATQLVRQDIVRILQLQDPFCLVTGFDRPNLFFDVLKPRKKSAVLERLIDERRGKSGIVYCSTRSAVEKVYEGLTGIGISATRYHAGLADEERRQNQDDFQYDRKTVMVATNAFGMGIDKSNVSFVIHYNMPKSLEAYYQEAGRAGRDGEPANCLLLYSAGDVATAKYLIQNSGHNEALDPEERERVMRQGYSRLDKMAGYCKTTDCLRGYLMDYFGQAHESFCAGCGNCGGAYTLLDITVQAQMILSCIKRVKDYLGYGVGRTIIAQILRGGHDRNVLDRGLDKLSTYGLMKEFSTAQIREYIEFLESQGYLYTTQAYSTIDLTQKASEVLFGGEQVTMPVKVAPVQTEPKKKKGTLPPTYSKGPSGLFDTLRAVRYRIAQEEGVPAYIVFSNATLADMAAKRPHTRDEFLSVGGVGEMKASRYAQRFLEAISSFEETQK